MSSIIGVGGKGEGRGSGEGREKGALRLSFSYESIAGGTLTVVADIVISHIIQCGLLTSS